MYAPDPDASLVPADVFQRMVDTRRDLHQHPELSWKEHRTAERIAARLKALGVQPRAAAGTGLVADLPGQRAGPFVALRADTDALPVAETTGLAFASTTPGVMHACGHDGHTSMLLGATELLIADPPPLPVRLLWQPAEEKGAGAPAMIKDGALDGVAMIFGGHVDRRYATDVLVVTDGAVNASTDEFTVTITGQGGHGARPHEAIDAIVVGSLLVTALQTIVSREIDPAHPSVVSVGSFQAGRAPNIIAGLATLEGTVRAQNPQVREHLVAAIQRLATAIGEMHGARVQVELRRGTPAVINTPQATALARQAAIELVGPERVKPLRTANMGGEDFACYLEQVPGCYIRYGAQVPDAEGFPAHSGGFDFDERAMGTGAAWLARVARVAGGHLLRSQGT